jgi:hypothetical protein
MVSPSRDFGCPPREADCASTATVSAPHDGTQQNPEPHLKYETLKIIVVGTPKTGNTWVRHLLSSVYGLPQVELNPDASANCWNDFGPRWIGQEHFHPTPELIEWGARSGVVFVTPVRHPGDVLVSLRHHVQNQHHEPTADVLLPESMLLDSRDVYGTHTRAFVERGFYLNLHLSIYWLRGGWSSAIRYEDLWLDPVKALRELTGGILAVSEKRLRHAVVACELGRMQKQFDPAKKFVRKGGLGSWMKELPDDIQHLLATVEPYPAQFAALGYSMRQDDPSNARREPMRTENPFSNATFVNGVPVAPILVDAFLDLPETLTSAWSDTGAIDENSFYAWLLRPASVDPCKGRERPVITELAYYLYGIRPDVREAFPEPFGAHRVQFGDWFLYSAAKEYGFAPMFGLPVIRSWAEGGPLLPSRS